MKSFAFRNIELKLDLFPIFNVSSKIFVFTGIRPYRNEYYREIVKYLRDTL